MKHKIALTLLYYDPNGRLQAPIRRALPVWQPLFDCIVVHASERSHAATLGLLREAGCRVDLRQEAMTDGLPPVGRYRRVALARTLEQNPDHILYCDIDRAAFWANHFPDELHDVVARLPARDFWVYGRSLRALQTHPPSMVQTEQIINTVFAQVSGLRWDVVAATRGLSAAAARFLVEHSHDDTFGVDASWPLLLQRDGAFSLGYLETEGMAYETADAFPDEIAEAGGQAAWMAQNEQNPQTWHYRLRAALVEVEAIRPFYEQQEQKHAPRKNS